MNTKRKYTKGSDAEEALRRYFKSLGFFVVRGIKFRFKEFDITDVDLWLYLKKNTITRDRANVDIKRKRTPQAMERIFWTKGLQKILGFDRCIVVTSDKRPATREFGELHNVTVLDGNFLNRIIGVDKQPSDFLTEEELISSLNQPCLIDSKMSCSQEYSTSKTDLLECLDFNGFNKHMNRAHKAAQEFLTGHNQSESALRLLYISFAFMLITIDYKSQQFAFLEAEDRKKILIEGFRYGESGRKRSEEIIETAIALAEHSGNMNLFRRSNLKDEIDRQLASYPAEALGAYFAKSEIIKSFFSLGQQFYDHAFNKKVPNPRDIDSSLRGFIGLFADLHKIDRKKIL